MSLNTIELPGFIIADLFKNSLVAGNEKKVVESANQSGYKFLGNNKKKITLVVSSPDAVFLPESHLNFITKMLEACKMNMGDVAIVNHASAPVVIGELKKQTEPSTLLLFGIEPTEIKLPISFPQFKMQAYDGCTYLFAPSLYEIDQPTEESKLLKSKLWLCLQKLFTS
jgi:hypothetical protein